MLRRIGLKTRTLYQSISQVCLDNIIIQSDVMGCFALRELSTFWRPSSIDMKYESITGELLKVSVSDIGELAMVGSNT